MKLKDYTGTIEIPSGVNVSIEDRTVIVQRPKGVVKKLMLYPGVGVRMEGNMVVFHTKLATKREKTIIGTFSAHLKNMINGVLNGYTYKLRINSGHFPMSVSVKENEFIVKNFYGEKIPRVLRIKPGATIKVEGNVITVESADKEIAGQTAGSIEQLTRRTGFDSRVFQDGIHITEKAGREVK